jgi:hypothetical protein
MAVERTLKSLANRLMDLDNLIEQEGQKADTYSFVESKKNDNTKKKTKSDMNRLNTWFQTDGEERDILDIPTIELNM